MNETSSSPTTRFLASPVDPLSKQIWAVQSGQSAVDDDNLEAGGIGR